MCDEWAYLSRNKCSNLYQTEKRDAVAVHFVMQLSFLTSQTVCRQNNDKNKIPLWPLGYSGVNYR